MGLLTDPNGGAGGLVPLLRRCGMTGAWLCYVCGVLFLLGMAHPWYSHETYFSEKALLPGLAVREFDEATAAAQ